MDASVLKSRAIATGFTPANGIFLEARFQKTFEAVAAGVGICDLEGRIVEANARLARLLGYERPQLVGIDPWKGAWKWGDPKLDIKERKDTESADARGIDELLRGSAESLVLERQMQRQDGSEFWGRVSASLARDDRGQPAFLVVLLEDAGERRRIEGQLRQAEKMAAIGQLAGGVAHDFNNLLTGILLYCDLLIPELEAGGQLHQYVEEIRLATELGGALTQQLLALARKEGVSVRAIDVSEIARGMENLLRRLIGEQIELITAGDPGGTVVADASQLRQILLNLVLNARDALGTRKLQGGRIRVSTRFAKWPGIEKVHASTYAASDSPAPAENAPHLATSGLWGPRVESGVGGRDRRASYGPALADGPEDRRATAVLLTVEDNGCGMNAETCARLFEPFFTTKKAGTGTGIGLGTVRRIVRELGGAIGVASAPGSGTRVEVFLPVAGAAEGEAGGAGPNSRDPSLQDFATQVLNSKVGRKKGGSPC